jgi:potassium-transporting ATPase ATP-binding subunit
MFSSSKKGEFIVSAGQLIPGDGSVINGFALVDESAITGESSPLLRAAGNDRSHVTQGGRVISGCILVRTTAPSGKRFLKRIVSKVRNLFFQGGFPRARTLTSARH